MFTFQIRRKWWIVRTKCAIVLSPSLSLSLYFSSLSLSFVPSLFLFLPLPPFLSPLFLSQSHSVSYSLPLSQSLTQSLSFSFSPILP